jgi:hypothetical protein
MRAALAYCKEVRDSFSQAKNVLYAVMLQMCTVIERSATVPLSRDRRPQGPHAGAGSLRSAPAGEQGRQARPRNTTLSLPPVCRLPSVLPARFGLQRPRSPQSNRRGLRGASRAVACAIRPGGRPQSDYGPEGGDQKGARHFAVPPLSAPACPRATVRASSSAELKPQWTTGGAVGQWY